MAPPLALLMVIEFATEDCAVDPLDAVVEAGGAAVEVDEDPVLDVVLELLGLDVDEVVVEVDEDPGPEVVVEALGPEAGVFCANAPADATSIDPTKHKLP